MEEIIRATGKCFTCQGDVPSDNVNLFYCSEACRIEGWRKHHPGEPEPDWLKIPERIDFPMDDLLTRVVNARGVPKDIKRWAKTLAADVAELTD